MKEIYKDIPDYPNYQVSNLGNVKSLNYKRTGKEKLLKGSKSGRKRNYLAVVLYENNKWNRFHIHTLVAIAFLNHNTGGNKIVVDHINNDTFDNRLINLDLLTNRNNINKGKKNLGVSFVKRDNKWRSDIFINGKQIYIGQFKTKEEALDAYNLKLETL
jgi:hypothetical protein